MPLISKKSDTECFISLDSERISDPLMAETHPTSDDMDLGFDLSPDQHLDINDLFGESSVQLEQLCETELVKSADDGLDWADLDSLISDELTSVDTDSLSPKSEELNCNIDCSSPTENFSDSSSVSDQTVSCIQMSKVPEFEQGVATDDRNSVYKKKRAQKADVKTLQIDINSVAPSRRAAVQAKINREKKKIYIEQLERERHHLQEENKHLKLMTEKLAKERRSLSDEVAYLRRVLYNDSHLSQLLHKIGDSHNVRLSNKFSTGAASKFGPEKRRHSEEDSWSDDHDYSAKRSKSDTSPSSASDGGMCLHVDKENITLEFCRYCAASN